MGTVRYRIMQSSQASTENTMQEAADLMQNPTTVVQSVRVFEKFGENECP